MTPRDAGSFPARQSSVDVYAVMNSVAVATQAVNLGQAMPSETPPELLEAAVRAVSDGDNHYSPSAGSTHLRAAVAAAAKRRGLDYDPDSEVTILAGCTEAIAATMLAMLSPGDEVLTFEPFYDSYPSFATLAGASLTSVPLEYRGDRFHVDIDRLARAVTPRTRMLLLNSPHNPTGLVLTTAELEHVAAIADRHDLLVISDEVYEELTYEHSAPSAGSIPGLRDRVIVCSSVSKSLSVSGWRVGWCLAPAAITERLRDTHRFVSYCAPTPLQSAAAATLGWAADTGYFDTLRASFRERRDLLVAGLTDAGMSPVNPGGGIVTVASTRQLPAAPRERGPLGVAEWIAKEFGVVGLPLITYYERPERADELVRFTFAKDMGLLELAVRRLRGQRFSKVGGYEAAV
jgi:N-succinyldiaminopimelate aminotransferase